MKFRVKSLHRLQSRTRRSDRRILLYALMAAVAVQVVFWGAFRYRCPVPESRSSGSSVSLLGLSGAAPAELENFRRWLDYHDPAHFSRSDFPGGFSAQLPLTNRENEIPGRRPRTVVRQAAPRIRAFRRLPEAEAPPAAVLKTILPSPPASGVREAEVRPAVIDDHGREVPLSGIKLPFRTKAVSGDTVLRVLGSGAMPTLILDSSCGDAGLDRFAQGVLATTVTALDPPPLYLIVRWAEEPDKKEARQP